MPEKSFTKHAKQFFLSSVVLHNFLMLKSDRNYFTLELVDYSVENHDILGQWRELVYYLSSHRSSISAFQLLGILKDFI